MKRREYDQKTTISFEKKNDVKTIKKRRCHLKKNRRKKPQKEDFIWKKNGVRNYKKDEEAILPFLRDELSDGN